MTNEIQNILNPTATVLNVVVVYDNLISGIKAKDLCDRLAQQFKLTCPIRLSFWSLFALRLPALAGTAAKEAAQTDLLIVAVDGDATLPPPVKSWISRSTRGLRSHAGALVAQFHGILRMNQETAPAYECLKHIADDAGVDFFSEVVDAGEETHGSAMESIHQEARLGSPVWDAARHLK